MFLFSYTVRASVFWREIGCGKLITDVIIIRYRVEWKDRLQICVYMFLKYFICDFLCFISYNVHVLKMELSTASMNLTLQS